MMGFDPGDGNRKPFGRHILKLDHMPTYHTNLNKGTECYNKLSQDPLALPRKGGKTYTMHSTQIVSQKPFKLNCYATAKWQQAAKQLRGERS